MHDGWYRIVNRGIGSFLRMCGGLRWGRLPVVILLLLSLACPAPGAPLRRGKKHFGWFKSIEEKGVTPSLTYIGDLFTDVSGGKRRGTRYLHVVSMSIDLDLNRMMGMKGSAFYFSSYWSFGDNPSALVGDYQGVDNIGAPSTWKVFSAQIRQELLAERLSFLLGLYDLNSEFEVLDEGNLFLNASAGIGATFGLSGKNGPSIYPTSALAFRIEGQLSPAVTARFAVLDGVAGNPAEPHGTHILFNDGLLLVAEVDRTGLLTDDSKVGLGAWAYTSRTDDIAYLELGGVSTSGRNHGAYVLGSFPFKIDKDRGRRFTLFGRAGVANPEVSRLGFFVGGGVTLRGLYGPPDDNVLGVGVVAAFNGGDYKEALRRLGVPVNDGEITLEATAQIGLYRSLSIQPDIQYVIHPNTNPTIGNALATFVRVEFGL